MTVAGIVLALIAVAAAAGFISRPQSTAGQTQTLGLAGSPGARASNPGLATASAASPSTTAVPTPTAPAETDVPSATPGPTQQPNTGAMVDMPFVPVVGFWSNESTVSLAELVDAIEGRRSRFTSVVWTDRDGLAILEALGIHTGNWLATGSLEDVAARVRDGALGIVRATEVAPRFRALAIDGVSLFGNDRVTDIRDWPLTARVKSDGAWNQADTWTLVAAGDIMGDRGVAKQWRPDLGGRGGDYLFDGGTSRVNGTRCCSAFGYPVWRTQRTGNAGLLRELLSEADVALANLETAVLVNAPYHAKGLKFTTDASLVESIDEAGFDFISLGNNHIRNGGDRGVLTAIEVLDERGIEHSGAGRLNAAGEPGVIEADGLSIAILGCDAIRPGWVAGLKRDVGTFNCKTSDVAGRIREIRADGADVVIVFPHWGREYKPAPALYQRQLARAWVEAGADLVIGAHSHIAGGIEDIDGHLVFYSIGNFIFDQNWSQPTMVGVIPELTFQGDQLVQVNLHATLIIDAQPNLLPAAAGGTFVFDQMRAGSRGLLDY